VIHCLVVNPVNLVRLPIVLDRPLPAVPGRRPPSVLVYHGEDDEEERAAHGRQDAASSVRLKRLSFQFKQCSINHINHIIIVYCSRYHE
jgi:hypothetical protein